MTDLRPITIGDAVTVPPVDPGAPPMLRWVRIDELVVDDAYQRPLAKRNWAIIRKIAAEFTWSRFAPVFVAPAEGGRFAVIDGQHRAHAAALCGFAEVPAQIVQMPRRAQADAFAAINGGAAIRVTALQIYRAALTAGEAWATEIDAAAREAGCRMLTFNPTHDARRAGDLTNVAAIRRLMGQPGRTAVTLALGGLIRSEAGAADYALWANDLVRGLIGAVAERPWIAGPEALAALIDKTDLEAALQRGRRRIAEMRRSKGAAVAVETVIAAAIGDALDGSRSGPSHAPVVAPPLAIVSQAPAPAPAASGDWTLERDVDLMHRIVMGQSEGAIARGLSLRPPQVRERRAFLAADVHPEPGPCLRELSARLKARAS